MRTNGKAGYFVWKLAGGQGDQDINLPCGSLEITLFLDFCDTELFVANPLLIVQIKIYTNKNVIKRCSKDMFGFSYYFMGMEDLGFELNEALETS